MNKYEIVKEVIDEWDPINLLSYAPDDEYDSEIREIVRLLPSVQSIDELAIAIHQVFVNWFGDDSSDAIHYTIPKCFPIAKRIWNRLC